MEDEPNNIGRKSDGRFAPGNSLGGRTPGSRNRITRAVEALLDGEHEALTRVAIERALAGDSVALRLCLDRIAPPRKDAPVRFSFSAINATSDLVKASSEILAAVAEGDLTPHEAGRIMALLSAHKTLVETADLEARIVALEELKR